MKAVFVLAAFVVVAAAIPFDDGTGKTTTTKVEATSDFLIRQKKLLKLLWRVYETNTDPEQAKLGKTYAIDDDFENYKTKEVVKEFIIPFKKGFFLPRGDIFSIYYKPHRQQMIKLFDLFYFAKDFDTFFKAACYCRDRVNEYMFVYAFSAAVYHREDCRNFELPPFYEIFPQMFVDSEVVNKAHVEWFHHYEKHDENIYIPLSNYTEFWTKHDVEQRVSYFSEDLGVNMFNKFMHLEYPFWMDSKKYGLTMDRKGELFYWMYQQLLNRYDMERLANYLPETEAINWEEPIIKHGYAPMVSYVNGVDFPLRPDNLRIQDLEDITLQDLHTFQRRIIDAIDKGYFYDREGTKFTLKDLKGIDFVGKMLEGFPDLNTKYYGTFTSYAFSLISHIVDPLHTLGVAPGVLEHYETAPRDPAFYSVHKSFNNFFLKYKEHLSPYKREELFFPNVKVENVEVDKLVTYFDDFEMDLYSMFSGPYEADKNVNIKARMPRLNHKAFTYKIDVMNQDSSPKNSLVRIFLAPKYNLYGHELTLEEKRVKMVEMDKFFYRLPGGTKTTITRNSVDAFLTMKDETTTKKLMKMVDEAIEGKSKYYVEESFSCGYPERLLLPRGKKGGMPFTLFVMVTPFEGEKMPTNMGYCDSYDNVYPDTKPFGYPFDRKVVENDFLVPNMYFKEVTIFHKTQEEVNKFPTE